MFIIRGFREGLTAEEIQQQYPSLALPDVYAAITWYLRHRDRVETYLEERARQAAEARREVESRFDQSGIRERLLARRRR